VPFLVPGRLVRVKSECQDWGWGVLANFSKQKINPKSISVGRKSKEFMDIASKNESLYVLDVFLYVKNRLTSDNLL